MRSDARPAGRGEAARRAEDAGSAAMRRIWPPLCGFGAGLCVALIAVVVAFVDQAAHTEYRLPAPARAAYCEHVTGGGPGGSAPAVAPAAPGGHR